MPSLIACRTVATSLSEDSTIRAATGSDVARSATSTSRPSITGIGDRGRRRPPASAGCIERLAAVLPPRNEADECLRSMERSTDRDIPSSSATSTRNEGGLPGVAGSDTAAGPLGLGVSSAGLTFNLSDCRAESLSTGLHFRLRGRAGSADRRVMDHRPARGLPKGTFMDDLTRSQAARMARSLPTHVPDAPSRGGPRTHV